MMTWIGDQNKAKISDIFFFGKKFQIIDHDMSDDLSDISDLDPTLKIKVCDLLHFSDTSKNDANCARCSIFNKIIPIVNFFKMNCSFKQFIHKALI